MMLSITNLLALISLFQFDKEFFCYGQVQSAAPWPMFGRNQFHTSNTPFFTNTTDQGTLRWKFPTGSNIHSAPCIGSDGTIYFGADNGVLYAINSLGSLVWSYQTSGGKEACGIKFLFF